MKEGKEEGNKRRQLVSVIFMESVLAFAAELKATQTKQTCCL